MSSVVTAKQKGEFYYLKGTLECAGPTFGSLKPIILEAVKLKTIIVMALKQLHGLVGAAMTVDILKCDKNGEFIIRVRASDLIKLWSSLTLFKTYNGNQCAFFIKQVSPFLMSLASDSRNWSSVHQPTS